MPPAPLRLQKHGGIFTAVNPSDWLRHWRHPNHLMLAVPWPGFFGLIAAGYLLLNLLFALLYWLDPHGIAGVAGETTSFLEAFFFSVQTLGSIGYGSFHPSSLFTHLVVTVESLLGLIVIALTTGMAFSRFSRSTARILFSEVATVHDYDGQPTLMFRLANERRKTILEATVQAYLAIDERTSEGHRMRRLHTMVMEGNSAFWHEPGIHSAAQVAGWRLTTEAVHAAGGTQPDRHHRRRGAHPRRETALRRATGAGR